MAEILVLQELEQNIEHIREALVPRGHHLYFVHQPTEALKMLAAKTAGAPKIDAIICAVYLEDCDVFDFVRKVKRSTSNHIPIVFYCYKSSTFARSVRSALQIAAKSTGVDLYITMENFDPVSFADQFEKCLCSRKTLRALKPAIQIT